MDIFDKLGLNHEMVDNMSAGAFNNKSYFGYKAKILKSGICKYYRRKQFDKFEWCVIEMILFGLKNKGLLTNVINRIKILLMEEIVCTEFGQIVQCVKTLNMIEKTECELEKKIGGMLEICQLIKDVKRARIVSYVNCWWRFNTIKYSISDITIDKVEKFKKENDSEELLKYGELFINFMENYDEKMMDIFHKLYNKTGTYGTRYRRKDAVFLIFEIIENKYKVNLDFMVVFEFIKKMFFRKGMTERRAFGVWLIIIVWKFRSLDFNNSIDTKKLTNKELETYMKSRKKISINESYVVKDYHISKSFGLESFGNEGSKVIGEDLSILGENGTKYRQLYIDDKNGRVKQQKQKKQKKKFIIKLPILDKSRNGLLKYFRIQGISHEEITKILEFPQGQKLTSSSKKSVYVGKNYVFKGPFRLDDKKFMNSMRFTLALQLLEDINIIPYRMKSQLKFEIRQYGKYYFIVSKNIGDNNAIDENKSHILDTSLLSNSLKEMKQTNGEHDDLSKKIKIYPRGVIKRINDVIALYPDKFTYDIKTATLQHLYFRYLLNIGDSGGQNVLFREDGSKQLVAGIDMEEIRGKDQGTTRLEYLFNSRYNKKVALFRDSIETIKTINYDNIKKYAGVFNELGIDIEDIRKKIDKFNSSKLLP